MQKAGINTNAHECSCCQSCRWRSAPTPVAAGGSAVTGDTEELLVLGKTGKLCPASSVAQVCPRVVQT